MTWNRFREMFDSVGIVHSILRRKGSVGFLWIEHRDRELHVHGPALEPRFRVQGIGTRVFDDLEAESRGGVDIMKLGVHEPNQRARGLYERLEFRVPQELPDLGFVILRKPV